MAASNNQTVKTALALIGLVGACAFTFLRVFNDPEQEAKAKRQVSEERREPADAAAAETKRHASETPSDTTPKALSWDDYLRYDPFEGRGNPTEEILALAAGPSPFFAETIVVQQMTGKAASNPVAKYTLSAILGSAEGRVAVIDNRPYRLGEYLLSKEGERAEDTQYGLLKISRIETDRIEVESGGISFPLKLSALEQELVRGAEEKKPAKKSKD